MISSSLMVTRIIHHQVYHHHGHWSAVLCENAHSSKTAKINTTQPSFMLCDSTMTNLHHNLDPEGVTAAIHNGSLFLGPWRTIKHGKFSMATLSGIKSGHRYMMVHYFWAHGGLFKMADFPWQH